jgi:hypothetical protein
MKKLGVIIPYRNRYEHLLKFKMAIQAKLYEAKIPYELIVVEQDNASSFNRGKLLNVGFMEAEALGCDYVVFHDVDMIPQKVDYSYCDHPIHLATQDIPFEEYFGGITMFPLEDFKKINGFSNKYWGWGFEDDDLLWRCKFKGLTLNRIPVTDKGANTAALKFNGNSSYVKLPNTIRTRGDFTIMVSLEPGDLVLEQNQREDKYVAFGIPGYDFNIMYTSFRRFAVEFFDGRKQHQFAFSDITPQVKANVYVIYDSEKQEVKFYLNTNLVKVIELERPLYLYMKEPNMYLGASDPKRSKENNFFRGVINAFAAWDKKLELEELQAISDNNYFGLSDNFHKYQSAANLTSCYDAKFIRKYKLIDMTGTSEDAQIVDCEVVEYDLPKNKRLEIPYRRESKYRVLKHEHGGFLNTGWKDITTRYNQLRFMNEVMRGYGVPEDDGLTNCKFRILSHSKVRNLTQMTVNL